MQIEMALCGAWLRYAEVLRETAVVRFHRRSSSSASTVVAKPGAVTRHDRGSKDLPEHQSSRQP